jgi:hypothetical protein
MDSERRECFDSEKPSAVREAILKMAKTASFLEDVQRLMDNLRKFRGQNDRPIASLGVGRSFQLIYFARQKKNKKNK